MLLVMNRRVNMQRFTIMWKDFFDLVGGMHRNIIVQKKYN